jgi:hypothetical protein
LIKGQTTQVAIQQSPNTGSIQVLTNVTLTCTVTPLPNQYFYFEWEREGGQLISSRYQNKSVLHVPWFKHSDSGMYKCSVYIDNGSKIKDKSVTLTAMGAALAINYPYFHKLENNAMVDVKGPLRVYCYFTSTLASSMGWYNHTSGTRIPQQSREWELSEHIDSVQKVVTMRTNQHYHFSMFHKGRYYCNTGTSGVLYVRLQPASTKPIITSAKQGRYLYPSARLAILCVTPNDYGPETQFTWLFNGEDVSRISVVGEPPFNISENPLVRNFYQTRTQVNLLYFDGQFKINGILSCVVSNALGRASADLLIEPKGPRVIERAAGSDASQQLSVGDSLDLSVEASGTYKDIGWLLNGVLFAVWFGENNSVIFHQCPESNCIITNFGKTLTINPVGVEHSGFFQAKLFVNFEECMQSDGSQCLGELESFDVVVYGPPVITVTRDGGNTPDLLDLTCSSTGNPPPTLQWKMNGTVILSGSKYTIVESGLTTRLTVRQPSWATYTCEGTNRNPMNPGSLPVTRSDSYSYGVTVETPAICASPNGDDAALGTLVAVIAVMLIVMVFMVVMLSLVVCYFKRKGNFKEDPPYTNTGASSRAENEHENENDYITMTPAPISATRLPLPSTPAFSISSSSTTLTQKPASSATYVTRDEIESSIVEELNV